MSKRVIIKYHQGTEIFQGHILRDGSKESGFDASKAMVELLVSDGYHTFEELYDHRIALFIALCRNLQQWANNSGSIADKHIYRSKTNGDGSTWEGWFILGIGKEKGKQITYHLPLSRWEETSFAETLDKAPEWDGHSSADVLERLKKL